MDLLKAGESRGFVPVSFCLVSDGGGLAWIAAARPAIRIRRVEMFVGPDEEVVEGEALAL